MGGAGCEDGFGHWGTAEVRMGLADVDVVIEEDLPDAEDVARREF